MSTHTSHSQAQVTALSPLDGRYANKLATLRPLMSEQGYMHRRVQVEVAWFIALSDAGFTEFKPLSDASRQYLIGLVHQLSAPTTHWPSKRLKKVTNHDVKAVEYWIKEEIQRPC